MEEALAAARERRFRANGAPQGKRASPRLAAIESVICAVESRRQYENMLKLNG